MTYPLPLLLLAVLALPAAEPRAPDWQRDYGPYHLDIVYLNKGTRSEGMVGRLFLAGVEVAGKEGDTIVVAAITLRHYGDARPVPWAVSGWNLSPPLRHSWEKE